MAKVALVIIYNHQYNQNIDKLEYIYKGRFSNIYHLVPFYAGEKNNVISVYANSEQFQGYIAQGFKTFFSADYAHYFFVADDLFLNPGINENNYRQYFKLNGGTSFLPGFISLHEVTDHWVGLTRAYYYNLEVTGIEAKDQMPPYHEALEKFTRHGLNIEPLSFDNIWDKPEKKPSALFNFINTIYYNARRFKSKLARKKYSLTYPMVGSYTDISVVSADAIQQFAHYCGVTAATGLFVEVGLPTALVLAAKEIVTETQLKLKGKTLWSPQDFAAMERYENVLANLIKDFPEETLYIHPVKLSKWIS